MHKWVLIIVLLVLVGVGIFSGVSSTKRLSIKNTAEITLLEPEPEEIKIVFVGDIMLSRNIGQIMEKKKDYTYFFASTTEVIRSADIAFANLESPVSMGGIRSGSIYSFRADPKVVEGLKSAGFDVVSIANNHIWDYGKQAFLDTLVHLSENGLTAIGGGENYDEAHEPKIITVGEQSGRKPTRVAFLAYTNLLPAS